ncbi:hypothetical protein QEZ54_19385 [Catellatospora sp. KI3]|uniref:hypothetical protein n=1 Tax=Catellatospora sp. KI3 TaxID=3041620 RepID=UPI00248293CA|nr:hypothetical protein [Catellatospora sp. KI3]MDI1463146.1 hypothetical protein [Catellatospora sp. KI3]
MVRVTNRPIIGCYQGVRVTVDVEPAAESSLTVADDFLDARGPHEESLREDLANSNWVAELTRGALKGARHTLAHEEYRTGPLRVVLVKHYLHIVDSGWGAMQAATSRAIREAIDQLPHRMVAEWVTFTETGPVVRLSNPVSSDGWAEVEVTIEVTPAAARHVALADGFANASLAPRLSPAESDAIPAIALAAAHKALDEYEARVGPLQVTLLGHASGDLHPRAMDHYEYAVDAAVRMAVEQLEFALAD